MKIKADRDKEVTMKITILLLMTFLIQSCDSDQRTRFQQISTADTVADPNIVSATDFDTEDPFTTPTEEPVTTVFDTTSVNSEPGFENCNLGYQYFGGSQIGSFGLCQSELNQNTFRVRLAQTDTSVGTCFVPLHINSDGSSFKLGIAECVHNQADTIYPMILTTERSEEINGVMVIKAGAPVAQFFDCMNARATYFAAVPNCQFNQQCVSQADQFANNICTSFVGNYNTFYSQVNL